MRIKMITFVLLLIALSAQAQQKPVVIAAGTLLDGKGHALHNVEIVVQDGKIVRVDAAGKNALTYDLRRLTVMPGLIDVHDHITWHFGPNGRAEDKSETP
ncbi:MAG TPA: amidohydrolase, partial [Candidatus Angelobacter sp.]|nr:amidohydrolase [Candidatus Angelobacter sp.]